MLMNMIKRNIPNFFTSMNLVCGFWAIILVLKGHPYNAVYLMFAAAIFDFIDGFAARLLKVSSPIGRDLDSLADVVTFGVLPGLMMYQLMRITPFEIGMNSTSEGDLQFAKLFYILSNIAVIIPVFSAIRLARFNNDPEQSYSFKGLPTPANGLVIACVFFWVMQEGRIQLGPATIATNVFPQDKTVIMKFLTNPFILVIITLVFSWLLISPIKLMAFKFKGFGWKPNQWKYILLMLSLPLVIFLGFASAPIILLLYIIISQIHFRKQAHEI